MTRLTLARIDRIRARRNASVLLYLTDRCPVGCDHCSVSALPRGARVSADGPLDGLVRGLAGAPGIRLVGISGGEPFTERAALDSATGRLAGAGKQLVLYTSGHWGRDDGGAPAWTAPVLARADCVVLSTDRQHAARIPERRYLAALRAAAAAGSWIAVQVVDAPGQAAEAERLLAAALGPDWPERAEIRATPLIRRGRAAGSPGAADRPGAPGGAFGVCPLAAAPVVRYDGGLTGCCNEDVVTGRGPAELHRAAPGGPAELRGALDALGRDAYLTAAATVGLGALTRLPRYRDLAAREHPDLCALCWTLLDRGAAADPAVHAIALAGAAGTAGAAAGVAG
ncbi:radical SAM protein [Streptacidiphilus sp. P02-A3a]|uniref:radical SAM protein n=1 Tax=Streptacidiphilus sp. P02-A3a TaxID=2704468 RepID=UPI0015FBE82B|nr:radical SAM protein [Streptacidiphilus sp. P02-A3a]QMU73259.1 hypothetical protein GXP74_38540 [Streptacidiphilus sp. P02-A3a]